MGMNDGDRDLYSWWLHDDDHVVDSDGGFSGEHRGCGASSSTTLSNSWHDYYDLDDAFSYDSTRSDHRDLTDAYDKSSPWYAIIVVICFLVIVGAFAHCFMKDFREPPNPETTTTTSTVVAPTIPPRQHQERRTPQIRDDDSPSFRMQVLKVLFPEQRAGIELITCSPDWREGRSFGYKNHRKDAIGDTAAVCGICTEEYAQGDVLMMGLCNHVYHRDCCLGWVAIKNTCPLCRKEMFDEKTYRDIAERLDEEEQTC